MNKEGAWVIVGDGSPYTYVGKADTAEIGAVEKGEAVGLHLYGVRQVQTIVMPTQSPLDPNKQMVGQENLVGPVSLCAADATMWIRVTKLIVADPATVEIIEEKYKMAERADVEDSARASGIEPVRGTVNKDGYRS
jgi:hypothetical protein